MTYERAKEISMGNVINLSARRYPQEVCTNLTQLIGRIICKDDSYILSYSHSNYLSLWLKLISEFYIAYIYSYVCTLQKLTEKL